jgi:energy-coupling factor transport system permease protein
MNAQKSRGADFTSGSLVKRAKALIPILVPLIISAFKRADELAVAMECRCYRGDKNRTKMRKLSYRLIDLLWFVLGAIFIGAMISLLVVPDSVWSFLPDNVLSVVFYNLK